MRHPDISLYKMSKDYKLLKELLDKGHSVLVHRGECLLLMNRNGESMYAEEGAYYGFSGGGFSVSPGVCEAHFADGCESLGIEFVEPVQIGRADMTGICAMAHNLLQHIEDPGTGYYFVSDTLVPEEVNLLKRLSEMKP